MIDLSRVAALVELMLKQQRRVDELTAELSVAAKALARTETEDLPDLMTEVGLSDVTLLDGTRVVIEKQVNAGITAERMPAALAWLKARDYDGIVKTELSMEFGRGELDEAVRVAELLREEEPGHEAQLTQKIHPQTLKAFVKERMAAGEAIPYDVFGIFPYNKAKLKLPRTKR